MKTVNKQIRDWNETLKVVTESDTVPKTFTIIHISVTGVFHLYRNCMLLDRCPNGFEGIDRVECLPSFPQGVQHNLFGNLVRHFIESILNELPPWGSSTIFAQTSSRSVWSFWLPIRNVSCPPLYCGRVYNER